MKLTWTRRSQRQLSQIQNYIGDRNPKAAGAVIDDIVKSARLLQQFPQLGFASDNPEVRLLQVPGRPYLLPYRVVNKEIEILWVFDERQKRPDSWL